MHLLISVVIQAFCGAQSVRAAFSLAQQYSGSSFFQGWDFQGGYDNTTDGHVNWLQNATDPGEHLAYVNDAGHAIITLDNTTSVIYNNKRDSVRMQTHDFFPIGSVFVVDAAHVPFGCSVWPAIWTKGPQWPAGGEIDIVEQVNLAPSNQMTLHTADGCTQATDAKQSGKTLSTDCSATGGSAPAGGCSVVEQQSASFGKAFADNGGGVWAMQLDEAGVFTWFWPRNEVPDSVKSATNSIDPSNWGTPSAAWPSTSCNVSKFFDEQQLVIDITLCGQWAGAPSIYQSTCGGPLGNQTVDICYLENVINLNGTNYHDAYFDISYIKVFTANGSIASTPTSSTAPGSTTSASGGGNSGVVQTVRPWMVAWCVVIFTGLNWIL